MKPLSIIFVDDEDLMLELGKAMLEELGYQSIYINSSKEALKTFQDNPQGFDLVITDYNMPNMKGNELATKLRKIRSNIPIILSTGNRYLLKKNIQKWDFNEIIFKPYQAEELGNIIHKVLNKLL
ncbi:MAG: CheY-like chemotaxis protein [bacterium]|jgi:CheY-like chemotaxis protein